MRAWVRVRDPRIALLMVLLGVGDLAVSQILMWKPSEADPAAETRDGLQVIQLGEPEPELPSPALVAAAVGGLILAAGGVGAFLLARGAEPVVAEPEDPLASDPELRALVERHEASRRGRAEG